jgi:hypothetical protein
MLDIVQAKGLYDNALSRDDSEPSLILQKRYCLMKPKNVATAKVTGFCLLNPFNS